MTTLLCTGFDGLLLWWLLQGILVLLLLRPFLLAMGIKIFNLFLLLFLFFFRLAVVVVTSSSAPCSLFNSARNHIPWQSILWSIQPPQLSSCKRGLATLLLLWVLHRTTGRSITNMMPVSFFGLKIAQISRVAHLA
jgi:hypothetical protein